MSGYVYAGAPNVCGLFNSPEIEAKADRLRDLFEEGTPVVASGDGLSFAAQRKRKPADAGTDHDT
ncbi:hypothetical protein EEB11_18290 [Pseudotabrizicola sediminis]|uniref:Uncharacterized protein n=1 Tax=Pseudotabrizicola sediminis TaxID=2486418 RepID=A0ABY2KII0_9RHOB|nr:hypothetical protein [Pseudotabrizicola sediminis]TGD41511.1 hypothetical protein EEB11_18290 [Pseudotabrizicola sediminis]